MTDLTSLTLLEQIDGLKSKKFSSVELTTNYLERIDKKNKDLN